MRVRADSFLGKLAQAAQEAPETLWRITMPPWLAKVLIAAGARTSPAPDAATPTPSHQEPEKEKET